MKRELKTAFSDMKSGRVISLPIKVVEYVLRRFPRVKDYVNSRNINLKIDKLLRSHRNTKAQFQNISVVYLLGSTDAELLSRSIFSLKKLVVNPHVVFIDLGNNDEKVWSIVKNYLPKSEIVRAESYTGLDDVYQQLARCHELRDFVLFVNEYPKFNELVTVLDKRQLHNDTLYLVDFIYPRFDTKKFFIDRQTVNFYENLNLFRGFFPLLPKHICLEKSAREIFQSDFSVLPAACTLKELHKTFDDHNVFRQSFELLFPVKIVEPHPKINNYVFPCDKKISIIIPTRDKVDLLDRCLNSIKKSTYENYEIIIVDHRSGPETQEYLRKTGNKIVRYEGDFNFSVLNNIGVQHSSGEILCFLNNDTEIITPEWMEIMGGFACQKDVGAVGAKLLFPNNLIQHAGIKINKNYTATSHVLTYEKDNTLSKELKVISSPDAVTGACVFVDKNKYSEVLGFDEDYTVTWQDVDLCLSLDHHGYKTLFIPYVKLYHYESVTRKSHPGENEQRDLNYFRQKWGKNQRNEEEGITLNLDAIRNLKKKILRS